MGVLGIDIGGSKIRVGLVENSILKRVESMNVRKDGKENEIIDDLISLIRKFKNNIIDGIGVGVPGVVDSEKGIAYNVINIPSWTEVPLKANLESEFNVPVYVNNDANCFVFGEKYFGQANNYKNIVGLIIGTGLGAGLILNDHLYNGNNCGAGEFGMIPYKDHDYEYYCCGRFFKFEYGTSGEEVLKQAESGDEKALNILMEFGNHLGEAIKMILFAIDPEVIVLGGSISKAHKYFEKSMWESVNKFPYTHSLDTLKILVSEIDNIAILGAAALYYDEWKKSYNQD